MLKKFNKNILVLISIFWINFSYADCWKVVDGLKGVYETKTTKFHYTNSELKSDVVICLNEKINKYTALGLGTSSDELFLIDKNTYRGFLGSYGTLIIQFDFMQQKILIFENIMSLGSQGMEAYTGNIKKISTDE